CARWGYDGPKGWFAYW
nr:immunoglobulin heavy chain junction region [Mus musculus]